MNSTGLLIFQRLCALGNALTQLRDQEAPCSDQWTALTCLVLALDSCIDTLVRSSGLGGADDGG